MHFSKWNLTGLELLSIPYATLYPKEFAMLAAMDWTNLQKLELCNSMLILDGGKLDNGPLEQFIRIKLPNLKKFKASDIELTDQQVALLAELELPSLETLIMISNSLTSANAKLLLRNKPKLKWITLVDNRLDSFEFLEEVPDDVEVLDLGTNMLRGDEHIHHFSRFKKLTGLSLYSNDIED